MSGTAQQQPSLNVTQDLSALPGFGSGNFPGGPANPTAYALNTLGTTIQNDINGNATQVSPYIDPSYATGLDLSTVGGLDTLGARVSFNDPNAEFIQDTLPFANTPSGNAGQNLYSWLAYGGPSQMSGYGQANDTSLYPDAGNPNYTVGPGGTLDPTAAAIQRASADSSGEEGQNTGPPPWVLSLPVDILTAGAGLYASLGADAGLAAADAGTAAGTDVSLSDLGAITAGAGSAGGAAGAGGAGLAASLGDTIGLLDPTMASGIQAADAASAIAGGADPAAALGGIGAFDAGDVLGTSDLGSITAGAGSAGGQSALDPTGILGTSDLGSITAGAGDIGEGGAASPGAGGLFSTADAGIDPTVFADSTGGLGPTVDANSPTFLTNWTDPSTSGFMSDLANGNFSNLGQDFTDLFSSNPPTSDLTNAASGGSADSFAVDQPAAAAGVGNSFAFDQPAASAGTGGGSSWLGNLGSKFVSGLSDPFKLLGLGASGIGLGYNLLKGQQSNPIPGMSNVQAAAGQLSTQGQTLQNYLTTGTLPAGVQASLDQATNSAIQAVKSNFASRGIAPGSTMEQQQIAAIQQNAAAQGGQLALNLLNSGVQESDLGAQLYQSLVQTNVALNSQTEQAIANLASALAGNNKITLQAAPASAA